MIETGIKNTPLRAVLYGPEGIGKTTAASRWPKPVFIDVESGTLEMDVARTERPESWYALVQQVKQFGTDMQGYQTLVIDTADWAERLCQDHVCAGAGVKAIGDVAYGQLYRSVATEWASLLDALSAVRGHVLLLAHSTIVHCDIPEETGSYDRYELKLLKSFKVDLAAMTKEWASLVLFCSYETYVTDGKASGGKRVMYTTHHPCWDAKQRTGMDLPEKMDFPADKLSEPLTKLLEVRNQALEVTKPEPAKEQETEPADELIGLEKTKEELNPEKADPEKAQLLEQLKQLMRGDQVRTAELGAEMARKGVCPADMIPPNYSVDLLKRVVTNWEKVFANIKQFIRKEN